jgi:hypothetical protein
MEMLKLSRLPMGLLALTIAAPVMAHPAPAPANPGAMPTDTGHHPAESRNGRPGSTINLGGNAGITFSPPTKNGHINPPPVIAQQPTPPVPWPEQSSPWNTGYYDQFGNGGIVQKVHAHM